MRHFLSTAHLDSSQILNLIDRSLFFKKQIQNNQYSKPLLNQFISLLFFEASTRTKFSFEVAAKNLGANVLNFTPETSSLEKGESLLDTLKTLESLGTTLAVIRHSDDELIESLSEQVSLSLVNAGAGKKEHPSQAILDLLTMIEHFGLGRKLKVGIVGDIHHSRVAKSNETILKKLGHEVVFSGPKDLMPKTAHTYEDFPTLVKTCDVVMMLRMQFERHEKNYIEKESYLHTFGLTKKLAKEMKSDAIIMHPAPINWDVELETGIDQLPSSKIFTQMQNGVYARMSILSTLWEMRGGK